MQLQAHGHGKSDARSDGGEQAGKGGSRQGCGDCEGGDRGLACGSEEGGIGKVAHEFGWRGFRLGCAEKRREHDGGNGHAMPLQRDPQAVHRTADAFLTSVLGNARAAGDVSEIALLEIALEQQRPITIR